MQEIQNFFVDYMANDTLGAISTSHVVHSDREPLKARSQICLELAQLHSMSVDFAKTGAPAEMPKSFIPKEYPDFMERHDRPTYVSTGVLGRLYRSFMSYTGSGVVASGVACNSSYDFDLEVEGFENYLEEAEEYYEMYREKFSNLMCYYKAEEEEEIVTGTVICISGTGSLYSFFTLIWVFPKLACLDTCILYYEALKTIQYILLQFGTNCIPLLEKVLSIFLSNTEFTFAARKHQTLIYIPLMCGVRASRKYGTYCVQLVVTRRIYHAICCFI